MKQWFPRPSTNGSTPDPVPTSRILLLTNPACAALIERRIDASVRTSRIGAYREINQRNFKFPSLDRHDICKRVNRLKSVLRIDEKIECKLLSDRTILIKRYR